ncbi:hypothetical protein R1flu_022948 [Riccia fluitans]|uniref:NB-ARC domain-containing protein n=1 Tax=Riccia fluitans TaxID=41844 RepID=A0ABD1XQQ9_9MARC
MSRGCNRVIWPKVWLPEDFPNARVLAISYDGSIRKSDTTGMMDLYLTVESLLKCLLMEDVGKKRPVILVGHSFGGIMIKGLCLFAQNNGHLRNCRAETAEQQEHAFLRNIRGIFYYSTPHHGSGFPTELMKNGGNEAELMKIVQVLSNHLARINQDFNLLLRNSLHCQEAAVGESLPTDLGAGRSCLIVEEGSARASENYVQLMEDHFSICQPREKTNSSYRFLVEFIRSIRVNHVQDADLMGFPANRQKVTKMQLDLLGPLVQGEILQGLESSPVLGLWGMGGIGKTTLSKVVFNCIHTQFEYSLFFEGTKDIPGTEKDLEIRVLEQMHHNGKKVDSDTFRWFHLRGKRIVVVLDDVLEDRDIAMIDKFRDFCSPDSCFLLTARDRSILNKVDDISIYEVKALSLENSELLFRSFAISPIDKVLPKWQDHCLFCIVSKCGGLPLVLEVVGKFLKSIVSQEIWEQTLVALQKIESFNHTSIGIKVASKLELSYSTLENAEKQMFIDAATFFQDKILESNGYRKRLWTLREAKAAWRVAFSTGAEALLWRKLCDRALVYDVAEDSPIKMHDLLKHLGQKLATEMQDQKRIMGEDADSVSQTLRCSEFQAEISKVYSLQVRLGCSRLTHSLCLPCTLDKEWRGTPVSCPHLQYPLIPVSSLHEMKMLRYVQLECCTLAQSTVLPKNVIIFNSVSYWPGISFENSNKLVILSFKASELERLPNSFCSLKNLRFLYMDIAALTLLPESIGSLKSLQRCKLGCPLLEFIPESFGGLESLQELTLEKCEKVGRLPDSFGNLKHLQMLDMDCKNLKELPDSFCDLENLQQLTLQCSNLESLPEAFGNLRLLQTLKLLVCVRLEFLPDSFSRLQALQRLVIWRCTCLREIPHSFNNLRNLQELTLRDCSSLRSLPSSFGKLRNLDKLEIRPSTAYGSRTIHASGKGLSSLPDSFGELKNLSQLSLLSEEIQSLPPLFGCLKKLGKCKLECWGLESLPDSFVKLETLEILEIRSTKLNNLPNSLNGLNQLKSFRIDCPALVELPASLGELSSLEVLSLETLSLKHLPNSFCQLTRLQSLRFLACQNLESMPQSLGDLEMMQRLELHRCRKLKSLPESLGNLKALQSFKISDCDSIEEMPECLGKLVALKELIVTNCANLKTLSTSIGELNSLVKLMVVSCKQLRSLPESLGDLRCLHTLEISGCENLECLPHSIGGLYDLRYLEVADCSKLDEVPDTLGQLQCLEGVTLSKLPLRSIPSFYTANSLEELCLHELIYLQDAPEVNQRCRLRVTSCSLIQYQF